MASTVADRGTKIDIDLVPTIENLQQIHTPERLLPSHELIPSSRKRRASPLETYRGTKHSKGNTSATSTVTDKPAPHSQALVPTAEAVIGTPDTILESPWDHYRQVFELSLGTFVAVVSEKATHDLFTMKRFQGADEVRMLQSLGHRNLHQMLECFRLNDAYFAVFGYDPISLAHIACSPPFLTELQLAAIVGQILDGLAYLAANGLEPGPYKCSNILLDSGGTVKITSHESCKRITSKQDLKALGYVTMELMQKYPNSSGSIGLEDFEHWPSDGDAVSFLAMTTSATSLEQLFIHS
ncbi:kinase-like domain-containing protein [Cadophora sp. MPI-SDFR-AT-0126]|nr:kinase-like domain-containing protein [Leotiomycetes sp. MPI-SDFR-AT-0126]